MNEDMIYIRFRDDPLDDAEKMQFHDDEYPKALVELERYRENWRQVWMYLEVGHIQAGPDPDGLVSDWVMLFDNTDPLTK